MLLPALPPHPIPLCVAVLAVVTASTDIVSRRIPNPVLAFSLMVSFAVQVWLHGLVLGSGDWLAGSMTGFSLLIPLYLMRAMSAGDVKLLVAVGAWVGPGMVLCIALAAFVMGGAWSLGFVLSHRRTTQLYKNLRYLVSRISCAGRGGISAQVERRQFVSVGTIPYGVSIAIGTLGVLFASAA
jgi:prepilin peptidase CpaA